MKPSPLFVAAMAVSLGIFASSPFALAGGKGELSKKFEKKSCDAGSKSCDAGSKSCDAAEAAPDPAKFEAYAKSCDEQAANLRKQAGSMDEMAGKKSGEEADLATSMAKTLRTKADLKDQMAAAARSQDKAKCMALQKECEAMKGDEAKLKARCDEMMKSKKAETAQNADAKKSP